MAVPDATPMKAQLLAPGARVGRYHLLRRLAIGGMAELHLACAEGLAGFQKVVVLKHVLPHLAADPDFVSLFLNEARLAATLDHANIVQVTDIGEAEGDYFYVMEYVHGRNAREILREGSQRGALPLDVALTIAIGAASGLHHAHEATDLAGRALDLIHRDVSPANLLVSYDGAVKLTDFGIAKAAARSTETIGGAVKGKIGYMSPEQCRGEAADRRSDVFALGVVLYELTTCERLFFGDNDFAILNKVISGSFEHPSRRVEGYPSQLETIVLRALAAEPAERYQSADDVRRDLEAFAHERRLRTSAATVADWMKEAFGRRPYPRVEVMPGTVVGGPPVPTLIADADDREAPTTVFVDRRVAVAVPQTMVAAQPSRRAPWLAAALACVGAVAGVSVWVSQSDAASATTAPAGDIDEAIVSPQPDPPPAEAAAPPVPEPAPATSVEPPEPESDTPEAASEPSEPEPEPVVRPRARPRRNRGGKKARKKARADDRDLNALYPVGR